MELEFHLYLQQVHKKAALWVLDMKLSSPRQRNNMCYMLPPFSEHNSSSKVTFSQQV